MAVGSAVPLADGAAPFVLDTAAAMARAFAPWFDLLDQRFLLSYVAAGCFVLVFTAMARIVQRRRIRVRAIVRLLFRRSVWLHRSSLLDYKLYLLNMGLSVLMLGVLVVSVPLWGATVEAGLSMVAPPSSIEPGWLAAGVVAALLVLAMDFGYWLCHLLMHKIGFLWEFHKLHHSALVMTPATEYRQHPVEILLFPNVQAVTVGVAYGAASHWMGHAVVSTALPGYAVVVLVHFFSFHHLRHSHVNIAFTGVLGRLLHSPAHHLIHHSDNQAHFDRNMGYLLSIWDWMAGTLVMPVRGQRVTLGIGPEGAEHDTVFHSLWRPVRRSWSHLRPASPAGAATPPPGLPPLPPPTPATPPALSPASPAA